MEVLNNQATLQKNRLGQEEKVYLPILNLGCGDTKIKDALNVDAYETKVTDVVFDITLNDWPLPDKTFDEVWLHHVIEHVTKITHTTIFYNCNRVLKPGGLIYIAYPDFATCAQNWIKNEGGQRSFWEKTVFGRQSRTGDYHVCAISETYLRNKLAECMFGDFRGEDSLEGSYYKNFLAKKADEVYTYEECLGEKYAVDKRSDSRESKK